MLIIRIPKPEEQTADFTFSDQSSFGAVLPSETVVTPMALKKPTRSGSHIPRLLMVDPARSSHDRAMHETVPK